MRAPRAESRHSAVKQDCKAAAGQPFRDRYSDRPTPRNPATTADSETDEPGRGTIGRYR